MKLDESNKNIHSKTDFKSEFAKKKKSLLQKIPSFFKKAFCHSIPKSPFAHSSKLSSSTPNLDKNNSQIRLSTNRQSKTMIKETQKIKENKIHVSKLPQVIEEQIAKNIEKSTASSISDQFPSNSVKIQPSNRMSLGQIHNNSLNNLVTQYQQTNLISKISQRKLFQNRKSMISSYYISKLIDSFSQIETIQSVMFKTHIQTSLQILNHSKKVIKPHTSNHKRTLPKTNKNTLVFDLDETLIHCNHDTTQQYDSLLSIRLPNGEYVQTGINIRPYARQCLKQLSLSYEIIVFTASHSCYAREVIKCLDPQGTIISHWFSRQSCYVTSDGMYIKDLRVIDRNLKNMLLIDNASYSYSFQIQNGVPIIPFYNNYLDTQLRSLTSYLKMISDSKDIQNQHCKILKTNQYVNYVDPIELINQLYYDYIF